MFRNSKLVYIATLLVFTTASCMKLGINIKNKTPRKAAKIPTFNHRDTLLGGTNRQRSNFDVQHYNIAVELAPATKSIRGSVATLFKFFGDATSNSIQLDLSAQLQIDSITSANQKLGYTRDADAILITLPSTATLQTVTVYYHGTPKVANRPPWEGGMVWKKTDAGVDFCGVSCEGDGAQIWLPIKMWLQDEPDSADMTFTAPANLMVVSNGILQSSESLDGKARYHWKTRYPINVYNISFYAADYKLIERDFKSKSGKILKQQFYVLPSHFEKAKKHFLQTDSVLRAFESAFGPYPWQNEPYKLVESPYEGMEHQTAIAYGNGYKNSGPLKDYIIVHETAHEWWGNALSVADFREVWLHEGFATYSEAVFVEKYYGYKAYLNYMRTVYFTVLNRKPVRGPEGVYYWNYKDGDLYMKGAATLHALRTQLQNDKLFYDILSTFYTSNIGKIVNTQQFIALVNQKTGKDYSAMFTQFLDNRASIKLNYRIKFDAGVNAYFMEYWAERLVEGFNPQIKMRQGDNEFYITLDKEVKKIRLPEPKEIPLRVNTDVFYLEVDER